MDPVTTISAATPVADALADLLWQLAAAALPVLGAWASWVLAKLANHVIENRDTDRMYSVASGLIEAAYQSIPDKSARYEWVADCLAKKYPKLSRADLKGVIEASVLEFKQRYATMELARREQAARIAATAPGVPESRDGLSHMTDLEPLIKAQIG